jgi:asparagine synthase (glutamine-hydrolysing)
MCGIAGIWHAANVADARSHLSAMLDAMVHRGPDGRGMMEYPGGAAGMVRLALVDLSERGQQPMWTEDRRVAILFNGEMYNFREERERLEKSGFRFRSTTDTEVVLNLFVEGGIDFVDRLRGMFAVAIFDWRKSGPDQPPTLVLVRGHFGIKPLYVAQANGDPRSVVFSSEIRALLASGLVARSVDRQAMAEYLSSGFIWQPRTIISGVRMMEPGTLEIYVPGQSVRVERFWRLPPYNPRHETLDEAAERLREVLDESIRLHALADAPVGAFLSGGVDSTAIVGLMRKHVSDLRTFTLRFPEFPGADECQEAAEAAELLEVRNQVIDVTGSDVAESLPRFASDLDQPSADGINTWLISRAASKEVKGVLSGLGGDEWFAGYPVTRRMSRYFNTPLGWTQSAAAHLAAAVVDLVPQGPLRRRIANLAARRTPLSTWCHTHSVFDWNEVRRSLGLQQKEAEREHHLEEALSRVNPEWRHETAVGLSFLLDTRVYMINQLLRDSDATSMAHSLELRVPFVDLHVVDFTRSCFDHHKLLPDGGMGDDYIQSGSKRVLIHAVRDVLPLSVARRPKRGFVVPTHRWLKSALAPLVEETCRPEAIARRGLIDPRLTVGCWKAFTDGRYSAVKHEIWVLMMFELWCREVLDPATTAKPLRGATPLTLDD